ncbi:MAG: hypothetical protein GY771_02535, partial [bacterium]|nr:hypothetical protein [bacterium]
PGDDIGAKLSAIREIGKLLGALPSDMERSFWMDRFASLLGLRDVVRIPDKAGAVPETDFGGGARVIKDVERNLLRILLKYPGMIDDYAHKLDRITFEDDRASRIFAALGENVSEKDVLQPTLDGLDEEDGRLVVELVMFEIQDEDVGKAASLCIEELIRRSRKQEIKTMFRSEDGYGDEYIEKFVEEQRDLFKEN